MTSFQFCKTNAMTWTSERYSRLVLTISIITVAGGHFLWQLDKAGPGPLGSNWELCVYG